MSKPELYEVEAILDKRRRGKEIEYKIKWSNYDIDESTWEPARSLNDCMDLIIAYEDQLKRSLTKPAKPRAKSTRLIKNKKEKKCALKNISSSEQYEQEQDEEDEKQEVKQFFKVVSFTKVPGKRNEKLPAWENIEVVCERDGVMDVRLLRDLAYTEGPQVVKRMAEILYEAL